MYMTDPSDNVHGAAAPNEFHSQRDILHPAEKNIRAFFIKVMEHTAVREIHPSWAGDHIVTRLSAIKVGTNPQRWHRDIWAASPEEAHSCGFSFLIQVQGTRVFDLVEDGKYSRKEMENGKMFLSSFGLPHRGVATLDTVGAIAIHGYVLLRSLTARYEPLNLMKRIRRRRRKKP